MVADLDHNLALSDTYNLQAATSDNHQIVTKIRRSLRSYDIVSLLYHIGYTGSNDRHIFLNSPRWAKSVLEASNDIQVLDGRHHLGRL